MGRHFKNDSVELVFKENILFGIYQPACVTLDVAQEAVKQRIAFSAEQTYPVLIDIRNVKSVSAETRKYLSTPESFYLISVAAIIVNNVFQETIGNIFIYLNKRPVPLRIFKSEYEAIKWLGTYK